MIRKGAHKCDVAGDLVAMGIDLNVFVWRRRMQIIQPQIECRERLGGLLKYYYRDAA